MPDEAQRECLIKEKKFRAQCGSHSKSEFVTIQMGTVIVLDQPVMMEQTQHFAHCDSCKVFIYFQDISEWKCHIEARLRESRNAERFLFFVFYRKINISLLSLFLLPVVGSFRKPGWQQEETELKQGRIQDVQIINPNYRNHKFFTHMHSVRQHIVLVHSLSTCKTEWLIFTSKNQFY